MEDYNAPQADNESIFMESAISLVESCQPVPTGDKCAKYLMCTEPPSEAISFPC